jgi:hypothetical protein
MQVYTPPGYATSRERYPVFFPLHGGGDDDRSWLMAARYRSALIAGLAWRDGRRLVHAHRFNDTT